MFCLVHWSPIRCFDQSMRNKVPQQNSNTSLWKSVITLHFLKVVEGYVPRYPICPGKTFPGSSWRRREPPWCRASPWGWAIPRPLLPNSSPSRWRCRSELQELCRSIRKRWILLGKKSVDFEHVQITSDLNPPSSLHFHFISHRQLKVALITKNTYFRSLFTTTTPQIELDKRIK